jgi:hypothetical protein
LEEFEIGFVEMTTPAKITPVSTVDLQISRSSQLGKFR